MSLRFTIHRIAKDLFRLPELNEAPAKEAEIETRCRCQDRSLVAVSNIQRMAETDKLTTSRCFRSM